MIHEGLFLVHTIALDVVGGDIYWATKHSVEMAQLNGQQHTVLQALPQSSSEIVCGLTVDTISRRIYWLLHYTGSITVFHADLGKPLIGSTNVARAVPPVSLSYEKLAEVKSVSM